MIYVFLADGFEEMEAIAPVDILKRAKIAVKTVGVTSLNPTGSGGVSIKCDLSIEDANTQGLEGIVLPGGMPGTENLFKNEKVKDIVNFCFDSGKIIGAICAAPIILGRLGLLKGKKACCFPGFEGELNGAEITDSRVCVDGNIVTGKGPGAALEFSLKLIETIMGERTAEVIRQSLQ
jgi:DJ-1 family protein